MNICRTISNINNKHKQLILNHNIKLAQKPSNKYHFLYHKIELNLIMMCYLCVFECEIVGSQSMKKQRYNGVQIDSGKRNPYLY